MENQSKMDDEMGYPYFRKSLYHSVRFVLYIPLYPREILVNAFDIPSKSQFFSLNKRRGVFSKNFQKTGALSKDTVDGCEILQQLKTVVYPWFIPSFAGLKNHTFGVAGLRTHPSSITNMS